MEPESQDDSGYVRDPLMTEKHSYEKGTGAELKMYQLRKKKTVLQEPARSSWSTQKGQQKSRLRA